MGAGRPTKYRPEFTEQAYKLCLLGATDREMADFFEVNEDTLNEWKKVHPEFSESLKKGKEQADAVVASKLYHRAIGYEHEDTQFATFQGEITDRETYIKHYPPDTTAAIFWLKNRQSAKWRDTQNMELTGKDGGPLTVKLEGELGEWAK
ncbi:MAG: helix-turn-helix domain-containing protein [Desulfocucumaceae bacterium]